MTSNVISPGPVAGTEGMERLSKSGEEARRASEKNIPAGRWGTVREIADATVYLFGDAGSYVNGEILVGEFDWSGDVWGIEWWSRADCDAVDGGSWHTGMQPGVGFKYPDFLLSDEVVSGVKGTKQSKL